MDFYSGSFWFYAIKGDRHKKAGMKPAFLKNFVA
jgi:hypothetical protein